MGKKIIVMLLGGRISRGTSKAYGLLTMCVASDYTDIIQSNQITFQKT
jgi:hypothetical protein